MVELEGERVEAALPGRQGRLLFAYLALHRGRPVRREELVAALWGEQAGAGDPLAPPLSRLRKALGAGRVEGRAEIELVLPAGAWVDWEAAHEGAEAARRALGAERWADALEAAQGVVGIADGGLLPGLEAAFIDARRAELADLRVEALEAAATAGLRLGGGELGPAESAARAAVEAAPFRESSRLVLMEVLRARGNVAEALRAYEDVRALLMDELGSTPGPRLVALHEQLLRAGEEPRPPGPVSLRREPVAAARPASAPDAIAGILGAAAARGAAGRPAAPDLVERDREVAMLAACVESSSGGDGGAALIEGPAGIGKTRLLAALRDRAVEHGSLVLNARGSELEREFPFGVVRQLYEGVLADSERRAAALAGAAAPAQAVFGVPGGDGDADADAPGDASFAALHGLFWLTLNLAAERPIVLAIDDLQWCDRPSLRFVGYLLRRLEGVPVLIAATVRTGEPGTDPALLNEIASDPGAIAVRPGPLSEQAVRDLVRARLGGCDTAFCAACHRSTAGNPLLLRHLLTALEADGVEPVAANVELVRRVGPRAVARMVQGRLGRLPPAAQAVAQAAAVLGESAELPTIATLTGLDEREVAEAVGALARAELLRPEPPLGFVHPLVRDAVYRELPTGERELQHARAARVLLDAGAALEQVATHLLVVPRRGERWVAEALREAARSASRAAATESAAAYLRRAVEEPPPTEDAPIYRLELGLAAALMSGAEAVEHLRIAYEQIEDPSARATAAYAFAKTALFTSSPEEARQVAIAAQAVVGDEHEDMRHALEAIEFMTMFFGAGDRASLERVRRHRAGAPGPGPGAKSLASAAAWDWTLHGGRADECAELALEALEGDALIAFDAGLMGVVAVVALIFSDREEAIPAFERLLVESHRSGDLFTALGVSLWHGLALLRRGDLPAAEDLFKRNLEELATWGDNVTAPFWTAAFLADTLLLRGRLDEATEILHRPHAVGAPLMDVPDFDGAFYWRASLARVRLAEGRPEEALAVAEDLGRRIGPGVNPAPWPWRSLCALALSQLGRRDEAVDACEEELVLARRYGAPGTVGRTLHTLAVVSGDLATLREAVDVLAGSPLRALHATALADLGTALGAAGGRDEARSALLRAHELAQACGAEGLAERIRDELAAAGAGAEEQVAGGVESLTATERRIAQMAVAGTEIRVIAQTLFLTPRDVEQHLTAVYGKLGVRSREELLGALPAAVP
jgi:DNA-binding SARP family transcriptional activator/tetratricopeptide (TPR) repeat protein